MPLTIRGEVGRIDWGYFTAAALTNMRIAKVGERGGWSLHAICLKQDAFNLRQRPLVFVLPTKQGDWRWPVLHVQAPAEPVGGVLVAQLGDQLTG